MGCMALTSQYDYEEIKCKIAKEKKDWVILGNQIYSVAKLMSNAKHNPHKAIFESLIGKEVSRYVYCGYWPNYIGNKEPNNSHPMHFHEEKYMKELLRAKVGSVKSVTTDIYHVSSQEGPPLFKVTQAKLINKGQNGYRVCLEAKNVTIKTLVDDIRYIGVYFLFKHKSCKFDKENAYRIYALSLNFNDIIYEQLYKYVESYLYDRPWKPLYTDYDSIKSSAQLQVLAVHKSSDHFSSNLISDTEGQYQIEGPIGAPFGIDLCSSNVILAVVDSNRIARWLDLVVYLFRYESSERAKLNEEQHKFIANNNFKYLVLDGFRLILYAINCSLYECKLIKLIGEVFARKKWSKFQYVSCSEELTETNWFDLKGFYKQIFVDTIPTIELLARLKSSQVASIKDSVYDSIIIIP